jgi:hypothetical protein
MVMRESVRLALEPHPPPQRHHHRGARPRDQIPRRRISSDMFLSLLQPGRLSQYFRQILRHALGRIPPTRRLHPRDRIPQGLSQRARSIWQFMRRHRAPIYTRSILPLLFCRLPQFFRHVAHDHPYTHAARRPGGERPRPPAQLPDGLHESNQPVPLLEHELPRGAPHVPAGAVPRAPEAAQGREGRLPAALSAAIFLPGARSSRRPAPGEGPGVPRQAPAAGGAQGAPREAMFSGAQPDAAGWVEVCAASDLGRADVIRFDHGPEKPTPLPR